MLSIILKLWDSKANQSAKDLYFLLKNMEYIIVFIKNTLLVLVVSPLFDNLF